MTFKVTGCAVIVLSILIGCSGKEQLAELRFQQQLDSTASVSIDSAYKIIQAECEVKMKYKVPMLVDSILKSNQLIK